MSTHNPEVEYYKAAMQICKEKRGKLGLTQSAVASKIGDGYAKETYNRYESDKTNRVPKPGTFASILQILEIDREELDSTLHDRGFIVPGKLCPSTQPTPPEDNTVFILEQLREEARQEIAFDAEEARKRAVQLKRNSILIPVITVCIVLVIYFINLHNNQPNAFTIKSEEYINSESPATMPPILDSEQKEIADRVENAEKYESLSIYTDPSSFARSKLSRYWITKSSAAQSIIGSVKKLMNHKPGPWLYGKGSRLVSYDIRFVTIDPNGKTATVGTTESWYLPLCDSKGKRIPNKNPYMPPYPVQYVLQKVNGRWLIQSDTTWYAN